jgi:hypothetical protein
MVGPADAGRQSSGDLGSQRITLIGTAAFPLLASGGACRVVAAFERSFYIERGREGGSDGPVACVGGPSIGAGPLNAVLGREIAAVPVVGGSFAAGDLREVRLWAPPAMRDAIRGLDRARVRAPAQGLGGLLREGHPEGDLLLRRARPAVDALTTWLADPAGALPETVVQLIGLGPGLTPAGDDLLAGALIALHGAGRAVIADRLAGWLLPRCAGRTSRISRAHLQAAAELGQGHAALHETLAALGGEDDRALSAALDRLDRVGHSSGWDALAGAVLAFRASGLSQG